MTMIEVKSHTLAPDGAGCGWDQLDL